MKRMDTTMPADLIAALAPLGFTHDSPGGTTEALRSTLFTVTREDDIIDVTAYAKEGHWTARFKFVSVELVKSFILAAAVQHGCCKVRA